MNLRAALAKAPARPAPVAPVRTQIAEAVASTVVKLRDYQETAVEAVRLAFRDKVKSVLLVAPTGAGKCLGRDTPIRMFDGSIKMVQDVVVGDLLFGPDGKPRTVLSVATGADQLYQVAQSHGMPYIVNSEHILSLKDDISSRLNDSGPDSDVGLILPVVNIPIKSYLSPIVRRHALLKGWKSAFRHEDMSGKTKIELSDIIVTPAGEGEYFGFEIDGDRLFCLGDYTVTHNTVIFSYIAKSAAAKQSRVLILAHRDQLIKQASAKLKQNDVGHGVIMAGFTPNPRRLVQVASVQTLVRRVDKMKEAGVGFDLIICDECHLSASKSYRTIFAAFPSARLLGVTGSPIRLDGKGLGTHAGGSYDLLIEGPNIKQLIDEGFLVRPAVFASKVQIDLSAVKKTAGDYDSEALSNVMDKPVITGSAIEHYKKICPGVPAVAWCVSVAHAIHVAEQFNAAGIPALALSGANDSAERDKALADLTSGKIKVITFAMLLVEGVDCPAIGAVILLRPTMSLASYLQTIGRGLRTIYADGMDLETIEGRKAAIAAGPKGDRCFVLDHAGLCFRHGLPDEVREWSLDGTVKKTGKKKADPEVKVLQCKKCWLCHDPAPVCPACGYVYEVKARELNEVAGELTEITKEMSALLRSQRMSEQSSARSLAELEALGAKRGYKPSWAKNVFQARSRKR